MTMPHLTNCEHSESGWCLKCVSELHDRAALAETHVATLQSELAEARAWMNEKCGDEFWMMNRARIQQSLPKEYMEAITNASKSAEEILVEKINRGYEEAVNRTYGDKNTKS